MPLRREATAVRQADGKRSDNGRHDQHQVPFTQMPAGIRRAPSIAVRGSDVRYAHGLAPSSRTEPDAGGCADL